MLVGRHQLWISLQTKENLVASRQFRFPSHAYFCPECCINTFLPVLKWIFNFNFNFSENRRGFLAQGGRIFQIRVDRLTLALWSLFQLESLSSTGEEGRSSIIREVIRVETDGNRWKQRWKTAAAPIGKRKFCVQFQFSHQRSMQRFYMLCFGERKCRRMVVRLTEGKEAEDDGMGDEVDGVAGAGEVELPAANALVH